MLRFHKKIYFSDEHKIKIIDLTDKLNQLKFTFSNHCLNNLKYRAINMADLLNYIKDLKLNPDMVFEIYQDEMSGDLIKICYRLYYKNNIDIILVLSRDKKIITIYINTSDDEHITLNKNIYNREYNNEKV